MSEISPSARALPPVFDKGTVQPKLDGWWVAVIISGGKCSLLTSGAEVRLAVDANPEVEALLIGEWMYGTQWANSHTVKSRDDIKGVVWIHDIMSWEEVGRGASHYDEDPWHKRHQAMYDFNYVNKLNAYVPDIDFISTPSATIESWPDMWQTYVTELGFEGLVFKARDGLFGNLMTAAKMKKKVPVDFVATRFLEGGGRNKGRLGTIVGAQYVNGELKEMCGVGGGFTDRQRIEYWADQEKYVGRVFQCEGKDRFRGGSLRHPQFQFWRDDKLPEQCIYKEGDHER